MLSLLAGGEDGNPPVSYAGEPGSTPGRRNKLGVPIQVLRIAVLCLFLIGCSDAITLETERGFECSGVIVKDGTILTAQHCAEYGDLFYDGQAIPSLPQHVGAEVVSLEVPWAIGSVEWGSAAEVGDRIMTPGYGCSKGKKQWVRSGHVTEVWWGIVYTDIPGCKGDSGAPVFDSKHRLIGVVTFRDKKNGHLIASRLWR